MSLRRCFWGGLAVLCAIIFAVAMSWAGTGASLDPKSGLLVDKIADVAFGSVSGESSGSIDVGRAADGSIWYRAHPALQFVSGAASGRFSQQKLATIVDTDGAPEGFHRGKWKVGGGASEGGLGSWSVEFANLKNFVKTQVRVAREDEGGGGSRAMATHLHVNVPDDRQVDAFLGDCREAARRAVELHLAAERNAAASSLGLDEHELYKTFAANCTDERVRLLQSSAAVGAGQAVQGDLAALRTALATATQELDAAGRRCDELQQKLDDAPNLVPSNVRGYLERQARGECPKESMAFALFAPGSDGSIKKGGGVLGAAVDAEDERVSSSNLVALCRMIHVHVTQKDSAGASALDDEAR